MRDRSGSASRATNRALLVSVDVVVCAPRERELVVLAIADHGRTALPSSPLNPADGLEVTAQRLVRAHVGIDPAWLAQVGAFDVPRRHAGGAALSVCYAAVVPASCLERPRSRALWLDHRGIDRLPERERVMVAAAREALTQGAAHGPAAFALLPEQFTLGELQAAYELLLGRRLHKASFRRSLDAARLVKATGEWRSDGRGRPAQLFRYAPRARRAPRPSPLVRAGLL